MRSNRFDLLGPAPSFVRTPQGGLMCRANFSRIGVFDYQQPDGTVKRELRHPSEVFSIASLESLRGAPIVVGHPDFIGPENWKQYSVGSVADDVSADGIYVAGSARVQDGDTLASIESDRPDKLCEISCGYSCDFDPTPGVYDGIPYDGIQRNIVYNHVGLGPRDWGRAGNNVRLKLDGSYTEWNETMLIKKTPEQIAKAEADRKEAEAAVNAQLKKDGEGEQSAVAPSEAPTQPEGVSKEAHDALKAENDVLKAKLAEAEKQDSKINMDAMIDQRLSICDSARTAIGSDYDHKGKTNLQIMREVATKLMPSISLDGKSEAYVQGIFEASIANSIQLRHSNLDGLISNLQSNADAVDAETPLEKATRESKERKASMWKKDSKTTPSNSKEKGK